MFKQMLKALFGLLERNEVEVVLTEEEVHWLRHQLYNMGPDGLTEKDQEHRVLLSIKLTHSLR